MNPHRAVALRIAGLAAGDRQWVLQRLPPADRTRVLEEVPAALRLQAADPDQCARWLRELARGPRQAQAEIASSASADAIDCAPLGAIVRVLNPLPLAARVEVLQVRPWRWKLSYLEQLSETERQALAAATPGMRPAARHALLDLIAGAIGSVATEGQPFERWFGS